MTAAPRVVMVSAGFWPAVGGAESQALELSRALIARGAGVRVLTRRLGGLPGFEEVRGVPVRRLPVVGSGALDSLSFMVLAFGWLLKHGSEFDAVHVHLAGSPALAAAAAGRWLGKPVVVKLGGGRGVGEVSLSRGTALGRLKLALLPRLGPRFVAVTRDLADEAREAMGVEAEVLPNGVDVERFRPADAAEKRELRAKSGIPEAFSFLYMGRFSEEKRLSWFSGLLAAAAPGAKLVIAGRGAAKPAPSEGVVELPPTDRPEDLYRAADAFVLPSTSEGLSNALLEAMACGLPVLASAVGGTPDAVTDGVSGLLFARDDEKAAKAAAERLVVEKGLAARLGAAARATAVERFSIGATAARCLELYRP